MRAVILILMVILMTSCHSDKTSVKASTQVHTITSTIGMPTEDMGFEELFSDPVLFKLFPSYESCMDSIGNRIHCQYTVLPNDLWSRETFLWYVNYMWTDEDIYMASFYVDMWESMYDYKFFSFGDQLSHVSVCMDAGNEFCTCVHMYLPQWAWNDFHCEE